MRMRIYIVIVIWPVGTDQTNASHLSRSQRTFLGNEVLDCLMHSCDWVYAIQPK